MSVYFQEYWHVPACFAVYVLSEMHTHAYMFWMCMCNHVLGSVHACAYVCTCSYVSEDLCIFPCGYAYTCVHMFGYVCMYLQVCPCVFRYVDVSMCLHVSHFFHVCTYVHVSSGVSIFICVSVSICLQVWLHVFRSVACCSGSPDLSTFLCYGFQAHAFTPHSSHNGGRGSQSTRT